MVTECLRCTELVSDRYAQVNSANDGKLYSCPNCTIESEVLTSLDQESEGRTYREQDFK